MMATPSAWAVFGVKSPWGAPNISIWPLSRVYTPDIILTSVDFPAPFSPRSAMTSPLFSSNCTSSSAFTPGKLLQIPLIRTMVFPIKRPPFITTFRRFVRVCVIMIPYLSSYHNFQNLSREPRKSSQITLDIRATMMYNLFKNEQGLRWRGRRNFQGKTSL